MSANESPLLKKIQDDLKSAMLSKDEVKLSVIRMLKSAAKNAEIANPGKPVTDELVISVIQKQLKQRQDSIVAFEKASRADLANKEKAEAAILSAYLPEQISDEELKVALDAIIEKEGIQSKKDFGRAMKIAHDSLRGKTDNKRISQYLNKVLL